MLTLSHCEICPRRCGADRTKVRGVCGCDDRIRAAKAMIHEGEEPCLIGTKDRSGRWGAGAVFFSGCNLKCVFCQNAEISLENYGQAISEARMEEIILGLQDRGAAVIDLVTPTPYALQIAEMLETIKHKLTIPVVYNCGGYESVEALKRLDGLIDIYMPDLKYKSPELSGRYSKARDYFDAAAPALDEMIRQRGECVFTEEGQMRSGTLVRHLVLPGCSRDSEALMDYLGTLPKRTIMVSLLRQYTPYADAENYPEINRRITTLEYERVVKRALDNGLDGFRQAQSSSTMALRPVFDGSGL